MHRIGHPPTQHSSRRPIHDGNEIQITSDQRDKGDVGTSNLIWPRNLHPLQQVREDRMRRV